MKLSYLFALLIALLFTLLLACNDHFTVNPMTIPKKTACNIAGNVGTLAGGGCVGCTNIGYINAQGVNAEFDIPEGVAADKSGNVYVADSANQVIRKINSNGNVTTLAGGGCTGCNNSGYVNAQGVNAEFFNPWGVAVDGSGNVYVGDNYNSLVRKIDPSGNVSTLAGGGCVGCTNGGYVNAQGVNAEFYNTYGLAVDNSGNVYVADGNNLIRKIDPSGNVSTLAGGGCAGCINAGYADGQGSNAEFNLPTGVAIDGSGNVYVVDSNNSLIRKIDPSGNVTTVAGGGCSGCTNAGYSNGQGTNAEFGWPCGLAVDGAGNLYVADTYNSMIRKIDTNGNVTTFAGGGCAGCTGNGYVNAWGVNAEFNASYAVAVGNNCNLYVADTWNNVIRIIQ